MMTVTQTIQSTQPGVHEPVDMNYYRGDSLAQAMSAMASAAADHDNDSQWVRVLSVTLTFN